VAFEMLRLVDSAQVASEERPLAADVRLRNIDSDRRSGLLSYRAGPDVFLDAHNCVARVFNRWHMWLLNKRLRYRQLERLRSRRLLCLRLRWTIVQVDRLIHA
jgi:hypothetical protein